MQLKNKKEGFFIMIRLYFLSISFVLFLVAGAKTQDHVRFVDLPLSYSPEELIQELQGRGLHLKMGTGLPYTYRLTGHITGLNVYLDVNCSKDTLHVNNLLLQTHQTSRSVREDYHELMKWMKKHYGEPTWEATVRSHPFARWYVDFDKDIVMIATAKQTVEVYFFDNHQQRNIDYYAILKYCERNPVDAVPHLSARACVTWRSDSMPSVKKKPSTRQLRKKASKSRRKVKARKSQKSRKRHR